jgi:hypothetical protein
VVVRGERRGAATRTVPTGWGPLVRYIVAATLARGADGGAGVGVILLATMPGVNLAQPVLVGGVLATC